MSDKFEFVIEEQKKNVVCPSLSLIEDIFSVKVSMTNGGHSDRMLWVEIRGDGANRSKAKDYIKALTSPEQEITVSIPPSLVSRLGAGTQEHFNLQAEFGVVIRYPEETRAVIYGSAVQVTLAASKLENLTCTLAKSIKPKAEPKVNRHLEEFALKLGYEQEEITFVFDKLGPSVDKNTFLNELINFSKQRSRVVEDRRSPVPNGVSPRSNNFSRRHPGELVSTQGLPSNHGIIAKGFLPAENHGIVARGGIHVPTTALSSHINVPPMYTMPNRDYTNIHQNVGMYVKPGNDFTPIGPDPRQEEQMFQDILTNGCRYNQFPASDLRHIVIDGSNVAMSHGNNKVFSCKGIAICVDWFRQRGHTQITVFVPQWRKESAKPESPITDQHLLNELEAQGYLTFTPSRRINGRRIVCYDDRFVVRLAEKTDGIIVSNDNFKDLAQENYKWKEVIERRLLMYSFVNDMFMPPDDPLGRHGPTLDEFLHKGTPTQRRTCPYGRRCTYGTRCKFHHPEREDKRLHVYQALKDMFPSQDALILSVMRKYPQEKDPEKLASRILDMPQAN